MSSYAPLDGLALPPLAVRPGLSPVRAELGESRLAWGTADTYGTGTC